MTNRKAIETLRANYPYIFFDATVKEELVMNMINAHDYTNSTQLKEKNPKQVLIDWVVGVRSAASRANNALHSGRKDAMDVASDEIGMIRGMCESMLNVLENSD